MSVQTQPPVVLHPDQTPQQQVSFINQNFQNLANAVGQNSFKIVLSGTSTLPVASAADPGAGNFGNDIQVNTIAHNLGYVPAMIAFMDISGTHVPIPYSTYTFGGSVAAWHTYGMATDSTNIYLQTEVMTFGAAASTVELNVKYYLLQETAN